MSNISSGIRAGSALQRIFQEKTKQKDEGTGIKQQDDEAQKGEDTNDGGGYGGQTSEFRLNESLSVGIYKKEGKVTAQSAGSGTGAKHSLLSSGAVSSAFTSTRFSKVVTDNACREMTDEEERMVLYQKVRKAKKKGYVRLDTTLGSLNLLLHCDIAPLACHNFIRHCLSGYYNDTAFHRMIRNFMVQGGDPTGTGRGGESAFIGGGPFKDEFNSRLRHTGAGILSMANAGKNTNKSQFFVTLKSCEHLNNKHTVFGEVVGGLELLEVWNSESGPLQVDKKDRPSLASDSSQFKILGTEVHEDPFQSVLEDEERWERREEDRLREAKFLKLATGESDAKATHAKRHSTEVGKYLNEEPQKKKQRQKGENEAEALQAFLSSQGGMTAFSSNKDKHRKAFDFSAW